MSSILDSIFESVPEKVDRLIRGSLIDFPVTLGELLKKFPKIQLEASLSDFNPFVNRQFVVRKFCGLYRFETPGFEGRIHFDQTRILLSFDLYLSKLGSSSLEGNFEYCNGEWDSEDVTIWISKIPTHFNFWKGGIQTTLQGRDLKIKLKSPRVVQLTFDENKKRWFAEQVLIEQSGVTIFDSKLPSLEDDFVLQTMIPEKVEISPETFPILEITPLFQPLYETSSQRFELELKAGQLTLQTGLLKFILPIQEIGFRLNPEDIFPTVEYRILNEEGIEELVSVTATITGYQLTIQHKYPTEDEKSCFMTILTKDGRLSANSRSPTDPIIQKYYTQFSK